ncbi:DMT family transporter [Candidatus Gottesmanbacteria bacterium]|nr:DMT family transporter [Candidatus Gottesmanbacteria bacterium]
MYRFFNRHKLFLTDVGLIYAAAIWGATFYIVKDSLRFINPLAQLGYRFLFASLVLGIFLKIKHKKLISNFKEGFILGVLVWILFVPQTIGLKYTTASNSGFITGLFVVFVPIFSLLLFKAIPSFQKITAILLATSGLYFLTGGLKELNIGDVITLIAAMAYALHILVSGVFMKRKIDPYVNTFQQFFTMGALSLSTGLLFGQSIFVQSMNSLWIIIFLALFPSLSGFVIQMVALQYTAPVKVAIIFTLEPVFAAIFAWTLGGEKFLPINAFGGLLIVFAMIISELPMTKSEKI